MKKLLLSLFSVVIMLSGCTSRQFVGVTTGSMVGGMFGSSIGGIFGGYRGSDVGNAIGMLAGGAIGAAVTSDRPARTESYDGVEYGGYREDVRYGNEAYAGSDWGYLEVTGVRFSDANENHRLDAGERAFLTMEIYNRGDRPLRNIAPHISCDNRRVIISPPAIVSALEPGQGFRYQAEIIAPERIKNDTFTFSVAFGEGKRKVTAKSFRIRTAR